jgi:hypothetical protein
VVGRKAWFGPRRLGWGLSPIAPEGWAVTLVALAAAAGLAVLARHDRWAALALVAALLVIVFLKGTSPGGPREWEEFRARQDRQDK